MQGGGDTSLGDGPKAFPETTLGFAGSLRNPERALEELARRYWKPVYCYVRLAWAKSNEDAKDLAQGFFLHLAEEGLLARYEPARGGFRAWLKTLLRRFVGHEERDRLRLKRGGEARVFPMEDVDVPSDPSADPEQVFDRVWLDDLVKAALAAVRERWIREGREARFRAYEAFTFGAERPSYADLATRFGLGAGEVEKALFRAREELRTELRAALARGGDGEIEEEWTRVLGL